MKHQSNLTIEQLQHIAKVCHQTNKAFCETLGDTSQVDWEDAEEWQKQSALIGADFAICHPDVTSEEMHDSWIATKKMDGWSHGPVKDPKKKEHPSMIPYEELPPSEQLKDKLFKAVVKALT